MKMLRNIYFFFLSCFGVFLQRVWIPGHENDEIKVFCFFFHHYNSESQSQLIVSPVFLGEIHQEDLFEQNLMCLFVSANQTTSSIPRETPISRCGRTTALSEITFSTSNSFVNPSFRDLQTN